MLRSNVAFAGRPTISVSTMRNSWSGAGGPAIPPSTARTLRMWAPMRRRRGLYGDEHSR